MDAGSPAFQERIAERYARTKSAESRRWLAFLAEASDVLAESLDYEATLSSVANLVVPEMADWCSVDILDEGILWPVLVKHRDPVKVELATELRHQFPPHEGEGSGVWSVIRTGRPELHAEIGEERIRRWVPDPVQREVAMGFGLTSAMVVPLKARGRVLGALTFLTAESGVHYDEDDLTMAEELAGRCALALDNALLHSQLKQALAQKDEALREREKLLRALELERQRLAAVLEQLPVGVLMAEAGTGRLLLANARAERVIGERLPPGLPLFAAGTGEWIAFKSYKLIGPAGRPYGPRGWPLARSLTGGEVVDGEELRLERPDGSGLQLLVSSLPLVDPEGRIRAAVVTFEDISAVRAAEEEAVRHAHFLEQFIGILGHDLRNPLQAISGSAQLLLRRGLPEGQTKAAARIAGSAERMGRMITDLLDFTRSRVGGGIPLVYAPVCLPRLAREIVEELEVAHPGRRIELRVGDDGCGEWDHDRIAQVIQNLVANALQYGRRDAPVRVTVRDEPAHVVLSVHNEGPFIPSDVLPRLFEPFRRATGPGAAKARSNGLGLGLYIARQIVLAHGGSIEVQSAECDGTTFTVRLPRRARTRATHLTA